MELFRYVAIETPGASAVEKILQLDIEPDLANSKLAQELYDPKTRDRSLRGGRRSGSSLNGRQRGLQDLLDAFVVKLKGSGRTLNESEAEDLVRSIFGMPMDQLLASADLAALRTSLAEQYLLDRLIPAKRPREEQLRTLTRLQCVGLFELVFAGGEQARRALRIPSCIVIRLDTQRLDGPKGAAGGKPNLTIPPKPGSEPGLVELGKAELELRKVYGALVSEELSKGDDDDYDSTEKSPPASAGANGPAALASTVLAFYADPQMFAAVQARISPQSRRVIGQLGLRSKPSMDDALEALALKQKRLRTLASASTKRISTGQGGQVWSSRMAGAFTAPSDGAPDTVGRARVLGHGRLKLVDDKVIGYTTGQLSEVYNIPMGSSKERELRVTERSEETSSKVSSSVSEQENESETEERFSLASESRKLSAFDAEARAGGAFSASYGTVSVEGSAEAGVGFRTESAEELSSAYAKSVVSRAATRVTERVEELRRRSTFRERVASEKEAYSNSGPAHITGIYEWINEVHQGRLLQYGERLMLEVIVPRPAANLLWAAAAVPPDPLSPQAPPAFDVLLDEPSSLDDPQLAARAISRDNYLQLAARYSAVDVPAPPAAEIVLTKGMVAGDQTAKGTFTTVVKTEESLRVPDGYRATRGWMRLVASRATEPGSTWYRVVIGTSQYKFLGGSHSKRTFSHEVNTYDERGYLQGAVPLTLIGREDRAAAVHIMLSCTPSEETMQAWRAEVYAQLLLAYKRALQEFQDSAGSAFAAPDGRNPEQLRRIERDEVKRASLTVMTGQHFERFNALPSGQPEAAPPFISLSELKEEGSWIQFFENAVEWENSDFVLYPYFWSDRADWAAALSLRHDDPRHEEFLRAGAARVLVPVRRGFESAVLSYLESSTGASVLWDGLDPDLITIDSPMYVAVWQEIKERQGQLDEAPQVLETWRFEVPTSHRILRGDGVLPAPPPEV